MQVTCPSCATHYQVDPEEIPDKGRRIRCWRCQNIWLQKPVDPEDDIFTTDASIEMPKGLDKNVAKILQEEAKTEQQARKLDLEKYEQAERIETNGDADNVKDIESVQGLASEPPVEFIRHQSDSHQSDSHQSDNRLKNESEDMSDAALIWPISQQTEKSKFSEEIKGKPAPTANDSEKPRSTKAESSLTKQSSQEALINTERDKVAEKNILEDVAKIGAESGDDGRDKGAEQHNRMLFPEKNDAQESNESKDQSFDDDFMQEWSEDSEIEPDSTIPNTAARSRRFRWGFRAGILIFILAILTYIFAPELAGFLPDSSEYLQNYVDWVEKIRGHIATIISNLTEAVSKGLENHF